MVTPGFALADIGTDHAYIPIYLVENKMIPRAYAMDVNRGPLARAAEHIREHGLDARIETRLSDGLAGLRPGEAQSIVIAGMGGALTIRILEKGKELLRCVQNGSCAEKNRSGIQAEPPVFHVQEIILQPQSEVPQVRAYLEQAGFSIVREDMVFEDGKYYPMMKAVPKGVSDESSPQAGQNIAETLLCRASADTDDGDTAVKNTAGIQTADNQIAHALQLTFGPELLKMRHPVLHNYLLRERAAQERILEALERNTGASAEIPLHCSPVAADTGNEVHSASADAKKDTQPAASNPGDAAYPNRAKQRMAEVQRELRLIDEALALYSHET